MESMIYIEPDSFLSTFCPSSHDLESYFGIAAEVSDELQFVAALRQETTCGNPDKLKFVGHFLAVFLLAFQVLIFFPLAPAIPIAGVYANSDSLLHHIVSSVVAPDLYSSTSGSGNSQITAFRDEREAQTTLAQEMRNQSPAIDFRSAEKQAE